MRPSENLSAYGGVPRLGVLRKESLGLWRGQGGRPKMPGRRQASLARRGFLQVENVCSPTTQASGFAAGHNRAGYWDRLLLLLAAQATQTAPLQVKNPHMRLSRQ